MKTLKLLPILLLFTFVINSSCAQDNKQMPTAYFVVDFMKVKPEMEADYLQLEEVWKKIHKKRAEMKELQGWGLYRVIANNGSDYNYNYVTVNIYFGEKQFARYYGEHDLSAFSDVLSKEEEKLVNNTSNIRELVREEVYLFKNGIANVPFPEVQWVQFLTLQEGKSFNDFMKVAKKLGHQVNKSLIDNGDLLDAQIYQRLMPTGTHTDFSIVRTSAYDNLEQMLAFPPKMGKAMAKLNPGFAGLDFRFGLTELYKAEAWKKVLCLCDDK